MFALTRGNLFTFVNIALLVTDLDEQAFDYWVTVNNKLNNKRNNEGIPHSLYNTYND